MNQFGQCLQLPDSPQPQLVTDFNIGYQDSCKQLHLRFPPPQNLSFSSAILSFFAPISKGFRSLLAQVNAFIVALPSSFSPPWCSLSSVFLPFAYTSLHFTKKAALGPGFPLVTFTITLPQTNILVWGLIPSPTTLLNPEIRSDLCPPSVSTVALGKFSSQLLEPCLRQTLQHQFRGLCCPQIALLRVCLQHCRLQVLPLRHPDLCLLWPHHPLPPTIGMGQPSKPLTFFLLYSSPEWYPLSLVCSSINRLSAEWAQFLGFCSADCVLISTPGPQQKSFHQSTFSAWPLCPHSCELNKHSGDLALKPGSHFWSLPLI